MENSLKKQLPIQNAYLQKISQTLTKKSKFSTINKNRKRNQLKQKNPSTSVPKELTFIQNPKMNQVYPKKSPLPKKSIFLGEKMKEKEGDMYMMNQNYQAIKNSRT